MSDNGYGGLLAIVVNAVHNGLRDNPHGSSCRVTDWERIVQWLRVRDPLGVEAGLYDKCTPKANKV